jgi:proteasome assembly chaperone (PAC2) family protein
MGLPTVEHILFIPGILLIGLAIGYSMGARAARAELERRQKERRK